MRRKLLCAALGELDYLDYTLVMPPRAVVALVVNHALAHHRHVSDPALEWTLLAMTATFVGNLTFLGR